MKMTSPVPAVPVLRTRAALFVALVILVCFALMSIRRPGVPERDPILIFGLMATIFISGAIAGRSSFVGDRVVFGSAFGTTVLHLIAEVVLPGPMTLFVIRTFVTLLWMIGAVGALVVLIAGPRTSFPYRRTEISVVKVLQFIGLLSFIYLMLYRTFAEDMLSSFAITVFWIGFLCFLISIALKSIKSIRRSKSPNG
jgi:hypothetical protein